MKPADSSHDDRPAQNGIFAPFRHGIFFTMWSASLATNLGGQIQTVAAAWMMTSLTTKADVVALVQTASTLPVMIFSLLGGTVADLLPRRQVMLTAQIFMLLCAATLSVLTYLDEISPWSLLALTFLLGSGRAFNGPSWQASVSEQVPREVLPQAVGLNSFGFNVARTAGPALGGVLLAIGGAASAFLVNSLSYIGLLVVLLGWKPARQERTLAPEPLHDAMLSGARYAILAPAIRAIMIRSFMCGLCGAPAFALVALVAKNMLQGGPLVYGTLLATFGIGAVVGAFVSTAARQRFPYEKMLGVGTLGFGIAMIVIGFSRFTILTTIFMFPAGLCWTMCMSTYNVTTQMAAPRWVLGRALSLFQMANFGGVAVGSWMWGHIANQIGLTLTFLCAGLLSMLSWALAIRWSLNDAATRDLEPASRNALPEGGLALSARSGPIHIRVDYRIRIEDIPAFEAAMNEKRKIRMRDGARRWRLMQDITDPEHWIERFESPTWQAYLHQRSRPTVDDIVTEERVRSLHIGDGPPGVMRFIERHPEASRGRGSAMGDIIPKSQDDNFG